MKISEIKAGDRKVGIQGKVIEKTEPRDVNTRRGRTRVCDATVEDETGSITLVLWGDEIEKVSVDDTVKVENGFVSEWNGKIQLSAGMYGKITVL